MANITLPHDGVVPVEAASAFGEFKIKMLWMTASERKKLRKGIRENEKKEVRIKALSRAVDLAEDEDRVFAYQDEHAKLVDEYQAWQEGFLAERDARIRGFVDLSLDGVPVVVGDDNHKKLIEHSPDYHAAVISAFDDLLNERARSKNLQPPVPRGRKAKHG